MSRTSLSSFSDVDDFEAIWSQNWNGNLLVLGSGRFRAKLAEIGLARLRLSSVEETLPRIGFISAPPSSVLIVWPLGQDASPVWGGIRMQPDEILMLGRGACMHGRTHGPCSWSQISVLETDIAVFGRALVGTAPRISPHAYAWTPSPDLFRSLRKIHRVALKLAGSGADLLSEAGAAHGLEQDLIEALIRCMPARARNGFAAGRSAATMAQFERLVGRDAGRLLEVSEIAGELGVSDHVLQACCAKHLGMGPLQYIRLRRLQLTRRAHGPASPDRADADALHHGSGKAGRRAPSYNGPRGAFRPPRLVK